MQKLTLRHLDVKNKKILVRVDFNVPLSKTGEILDDTRISASLPSIQYILQHGGSAILMSHLGRPKGRASKEFSLEPCAKRLSEFLKVPVALAPDCIGTDVKKMVALLQPGQVLLLENLRFHEGEEHPEKDPSFAKELALLGDAYVNDAFGTAHRAHASTEQIAHYFPDKAAAGFLMEKEISFLGSIFTQPVRPFYALIGGAKISTKLGVLKALISKVDGLLIGGGMAYTFFKAQDIPIGLSIYEKDCVNEAKNVMDLCRKRGIPLLLPIDTVIVPSIEEPSKMQVVESRKGIPLGYEGVDIGPQTIQIFVNLLKQAATVFWNGPLGVFENPLFAVGTQSIAKALGDLKATTIVGGGDSIAALQAAGLAERMSHVSTGGGASLEFIEHGILPGISALSNNKTLAIK